MLIPPGVLAGILFALFIVLVAFVIMVLLYRDIRSKQKVFGVFADHLDEFVVIMTRDGNVLDVLPKMVNDPLYEQLALNHSFDSILSIADLDRLNDYIRGLDAYPDIPFIFSYNGDSGVLWYELRAVVQKGGDDSHYVYLIKNVSFDVESRNQRDRIQKNMDLLLQSTGDFLWSLDVEKRQFALLTPITDDEGRVVPRTVGIQDIHTILPPADFAQFEKFINTRIVEFRSSGIDNEENFSIRLRLFGQEGKFYWYSLRCKVGYDENSRLFLKGTARRMEALIEAATFEDDGKDALLSSAFAFPDQSMFCMDRDYKLVSCNLTFAMEHGLHSIRHAEGRRMKDILRTKYYTFFLGLCSNSFESGKPISWRGPIETEDRLLLFNATPIKVGDVVSKMLCMYMYIDKCDFEKFMNIESEA